MKKFLLLLLMFIPALAIADETGKCGDNVTYRFDSSSQTLYISGQGRMYDYMGSIPIRFVPTVWTGSQLRGGISFDINTDGPAPVTRGYATTADNALSTITDFQVWAYDDTNNNQYMGTSSSTGRIVAGDGAGAWSYTPQQFWPVNALNFVAVTPAAAPTGGTLTHATASATNVVTLTSTFVNPTDVENQVDLMYAEADGITKAGVDVTPSTADDGDVPLMFKHALSQVVFKGKLPSSGAVTKVSIAEISLCNIKKAGTLIFNSNGNFYGGTALSPVLQPVTSGTPATFTLVARDMEGSVFEAGVSGIVAGTAFDLTTSESVNSNAWFMVPQTTAAWAGPAAIGATPASGAYLKVRAQLEKDGVVILGNAAADAFYIPLSVNWDRSKKYIYTIEFNGSNALTPITFSVAAQDWTDADPQPGGIAFNIAGEGSQVTRGLSTDPDKRPWEKYKSDIKHIIIGEGVTYVGEYTFDGLDNLESVVFPSSLKEIGQSSFNDCSSLLNIYCYATRVPEYAEDGLDTSSDNCKLHVPASAVDTYKQYFDGIFQKNGNKYFRYIDALQDSDPTPTSIITLKSEVADNSQIFTLSGQRITNPKPGIYIQGGKKVVVK